MTTHTRVCTSQTEDKRIAVYICDLFAFTSDEVGKFDAAWDRGSLVAIKGSDRAKYVISSSHFLL